MKDYTGYQLVDFLTNDSFIKWAGSKPLDKNNFWSSWPQKYPQQAEAYYQALEIASGLKIEPFRELPDSEVSQLITEISAKTADVLPAPPTGSVRQLQWYQSSWLKIAASVLLISTLGILTYEKLHPLKTAQIQLVHNRTISVTKPGVIRLPDNSTVVLKAGGRLSYSASFDKTTRDVYLDGEAFFEVSKNAKRPFLVHANELTTKVLGTSFTVKAYRGDKEYKVTVNTGKVAVTTSDAVNYSANQSGLKDNANAVLITPNQELTFYKKEVKLVKKKLEMPTELSNEVTEVKFNFVETPLSEVIASLSKAYDIKISYNEDKLANCPLTASLSTQHLYEKLDLICQAVEAKYKIVDGAIVIDGRGCTN